MGATGSAGGGRSPVDSAQGHVACTHMQLSTGELTFPRLRARKHMESGTKTAENRDANTIYAGSQQRKEENRPNPSKASE